MRIKTVRWPAELLWRIDRYMRAEGIEDFATAVRMLVKRALGPMDFEEERDWRLHQRDVQKDGEIKEAVALAPPPTACPTCGHSEVPLLGGAILRINSTERTWACNNDDCKATGVY